MYKKLKHNKIELAAFYNFIKDFTDKNERIKMVLK